MRMVRKIALENNGTSSPEFEQNIVDKRFEHVFVYVVGVILVFVVGITRVVLFFHMCIMSSRNLHDGMFRGITRTYMSFFSSNPSGSILSRFSSDIDMVDMLMPLFIFEAIVVR